MFHVIQQQRQWIGDTSFHVGFKNFEGLLTLSGAVLNNLN